MYANVGNFRIEEKNTVHYSRLYLQVGNTANENRKTRMWENKN